MPATLIDTNVLFDFLSQDAGWFDWSSAMIVEAADRGTVVINPIVYAEISVRYDRIEDVEAALPGEYFVRAPLPWDAAFLAAKCFDRYARRYRTYFPKLKLITP